MGAHLVCDAAVMLDDVFFCSGDDCLARGAMNATVSARFGHSDMCGIDRSLQGLFRYCVVFPSITGYEFRIDRAPYVLQIANSGGEADIDP